MTYFIRRTLDTTNNKCLERLIKRKVDNSQVATSTEHRPITYIVGCHGLSNDKDDCYTHPLESLVKKRRRQQKPEIWVSPASAWEAPDGV